MPPIKNPRVGEVRPSQIIFSYGVGAIVDLPHLSVLVMGLDDWTVDAGLSRVIEEERLLRAVRSQLGSQVQRLLAPPAVQTGNRAIDLRNDLQRIGVPVALFPRWMLCPRCQCLAPLSDGLFTRKDDYFHPERTRYVHSGCQTDKHPIVVPARFLVACEHGHLDDFPWVEFVHRGPTTCETQLRLIEYGPSGEARDLIVRCETCKQTRRLAEAFGEEGRARMPKCRGRRPHLRDVDPQGCDQQVRAILLGASNLWFGDTVIALAIPTESAKLAQLVANQWSSLQQIPSEQFITLMRGMKPNPFGDFIGYSDSEIWQAIVQRRAQEAQGEPDNPIDLKGREWEQFAHPASYTASPDFRLREVAAPSGFASVLKRVVLVERLREVRALIGFTRIDAPNEIGMQPEGATQRRMALARKAPAWVPAAEVRGEGIFIQFDEEAVQRWSLHAATLQREAQFSLSHTSWRRARRLIPPEADFPAMRYVLLHTFAHALMRQLVLECGYNAASLRERIYARSPSEPDATQREPMAGVLIYTAAPDSEGTLGGLVGLGEPEPLRRHLQAALRDAMQCASDPLCAEHEPSLRGTTVHASACHACLFAPETSCERGNRYLDRSVLVPTVEREDLAFFE
ncbi:MAG: DUF1998 domain-containing protein [Candidatus Viridilinea halotolerans]|uniref:DUF1998 domain-containing protein n=1 Tax=Candidatus Viridilinea halotolerans TaxID=2491704 RepID=A0A426TQU7_9CHLR|nr:MAG: DUF1998 domain-containing protein [Candidatus Viridilinea halotolerans]